MLKDRADALVDSFMCIAGQVKTRQLASEPVTLEVTAMLVAQRALSPWARAPVDTLSRSTVPAPINVGLGQDLEESGCLGLWLSTSFGSWDRGR